MSDIIDEVVIIKARKLGLNAIKSIPTCVSVNLFVDGENLTVHRNGDVDSEHYRYTETVSAPNGLVIIGY